MNGPVVAFNEGFPVQALDMDGPEARVGGHDEAFHAG